MSTSGTRNELPSAKGKRVSTSITSEGARAGPDVPSRADPRRPGVKDRASMYETGGLNKRNSTTVPRSSTTIVRNQAARVSQPAKTNTSTIAPRSSQKPKVSDVEQATEALRKQVQDQEKTIATLAKRADRAAAAEVSFAKLKAEKEKLESDLASKTTKAQKLDTRVTEMASRLLQADKRSKSSEAKVVDLQKRNDELTTKCQAALDLAAKSPSTSTNMTDLEAENADLRSQLEIAKAEIEAGEAELDYQRELERANAAIHKEYAIMVNTVTSKNSLILELQDTVEDQQAKIIQLEGSVDPTRIEVLQKELVKAKAERDQVEFNALNGLKQFKHLKQKPPQKLTLAAPTTVATVGPTPCPTTHHLASLKCFKAQSPSAPTSLSPNTLVNIIVHLASPSSKTPTLLSRFYAALSKTDTKLTYHGDAAIIAQIKSAASAIETEQTTLRAKCIELRAHLQGQARELAALKFKAEEDIRDLQARHCVVPEHRGAADQLRAMQERLDMQSVLLARFEVAERGLRVEEYEWRNEDLGA